MPDSFDETTPIVHVISDSLGDTACEVVLAAAGQFDEGSIRISRLPKVSHIAQVTSYLDMQSKKCVNSAVFHTIVNTDLRHAVMDECVNRNIPNVDLMGPATCIISQLTGKEPHGIPGTIHRTDQRYFKRIEAMEYFVEHDDGRGADDIRDADIVLLGISRTSKTPLSMYLAFQGYRVANIPLALEMEPPQSIFEVDPMRLFGLLSTTDVIADIRDRRLGDDYSRAWASSYSDPESITREMEEAHKLMKRLGCFVIRTDRKAIEESAAEIIDHLETVQAARAVRARKNSK